MIKRQPRWRVKIVHVSGSRKGLTDFRYPVAATEHEAIQICNTRHKRALFAVPTKSQIASMLLSQGELHFDDRDVLAMYNYLNTERLCKDWDTLEPHTQYLLRKAKLAV